MSFKYKILIFFLFIVLFITAGCEKNPAQPDYQKEITIFGYLYGNENLGPEHAIRIFNTQPVTAYYDPDKAAVTGAEVTITCQSDGIATKLNHSATQAGHYYNNSLQIKPKETYLLTVKVGNKVLTARTTVPAELVTESQLSDSLVNYENKKNLGYDKPVYLEHENKDQLIMVEMYCNEPFNNAEYIYPFHDHKYPDDEDEYEGGGNGEPRRIWALVPYKDLVSGQHDNRHTVFWYSSMIVFFGSNTMHIMAIDDNIHNYMMGENPELSGGVNSGIGVFGSLCGTKYEIFIKK